MPDERRRSSDQCLADINENLEAIRAELGKIGEGMVYLLGEPEMGIKGKVHELDASVERHERAYQRGKGVMALLTFVVGAGFVDWVRNHWGWK